MKTNCIVLSDADLADVRKEIVTIQALVQSSANDLAIRIRSKAPHKSFDLIKGIRPSDWEENSAYPGKIVREVFMDAGMNDTFVKVSKAGIRYYYPASQEYGFLIARRSTLTPQQSAVYSSASRQKHVPGKYFMADTFVEYVPKFTEEVEKVVIEVVSK